LFAIGFWWFGKIVVEDENIFVIRKNEARDMHTCG
jgi:hypothetical protein